MKTTKIRLFATMITLAAVITITSTPAFSQRRSTGRETTNSGVLKSDESRKRTVKKRSTFRNDDKVDRTPRTESIKKNRNARRSSTSSVSRNRKSKSSSDRVSARQSTTRNSGAISGRRTSKSRDNLSAKSNYRSAKGNSSGSKRRSSSVVTDSHRSGSTSARVLASHRKSDRHISAASSSSGRRETSSSVNRRERYHLNKSDRRYAPNTNYRGSSRTWSNNYRPKSMNYNYNSYNYYTTYNYYNHTHWDHHWENYRWSYNSWRDYYNGYNPYSYRYNKYYYYDSYYGDVIRRFVYKPLVFVHNHRRYYSYNGHFFRYYRGVGYVLVDIPFGFTFKYLPENYERVYINGYLYFRVGNLFFEYSNRRFQLVHYPERYYAYDYDYQDDDYYYDEW